MLVPDKALNALPFAALMNPATGRYLIEDFEVSLVPSGQLFMLSASRDRELARESFSPSVLIVANPSFSRKIWSWLPDLDKGASKEGENVTKLFPGAKLLQGAAATREGFLRSLGDAEIVHFAGHAVVDREAPLSSGLILAPSYNGDSGLLRTRISSAFPCLRHAWWCSAPAARLAGRFRVGKGLLAWRDPSWQLAYPRWLPVFGQSTIRQQPRSWRPSIKAWRKGKTASGTAGCSTRFPCCRQRSPGGSPPVGCVRASGKCKSETIGFLRGGVRWL